MKAIDDRVERVRHLLLGEGNDRLKDQTLTKYGIQILDVRVRRFSYPQAVRDEIAKRIVGQPNRWRYRERVLERQAY